MKAMMGMELAKELFAGAKPLDHDAQEVLNKTYKKSLRLEKQRKEISQETSILIITK